MQLCLVEFTRPNKETGEFFSPEFVDAISKHDIDEIILFQPTDHVCLELREELKVKLQQTRIEIGDTDKDNIEIQKIISQN